MDNLSVQEQVFVAIVRGDSYPVSHCVVSHQFPEHELLDAKNAAVVVAGISYNVFVLSVNTDFPEVVLFCLEKTSRASRSMATLHTFKQV